MKITVAMSAFGHESSLKAALQSIFAQSFADWQLIIVLDGWQGLRKSVAELVTDPRVQVVKSQNHRSLAQCLNEAISMAEGDYIARMDADDIMHPERLAAQVDFLDKNPEVQVVGSHAYVIDEGNRVVGWRKSGPTPASQRQLLGKIALLHPTVTGRRTWFRANQYAPEYFRCEDRELWYRTWATGSFAILPKCLLYYRDISTVNLQKYAQICNTDVRLALRYGRAWGEYGAAARFVMWTYTKRYGYVVGRWLGLEQALVKRRNISLSEVGYQEATDGLRRVLETDLPGKARFSEEVMVGEESAESAAFGE